MSILSQVTTQAGPQTGIRAVIAGIEGIGKTTLALGAPNRLYVPLEKGYDSSVLNKTPLVQNYDEVNELLDDIIDKAQKGKFTYKSIIFDSCTALERFIHDKTLRRDVNWSTGNPKAITMESALGGYGKAYLHANELFGNILTKCDTLAIYGGINIIFTCHVFASKIIDPTCGEYDFWELLLHSPKNNKTYGKREMLTQWADLIGFLHEPLVVSKDEGSKFSRGVSTNRGRILGMERTPSYIGKNRFDITGEVAIGKERSWNYLADAIYKNKGIDVFNRELK